jgi:alanyl-tRNA synthetase
MTEKLYYKDAYIKEFNAEVLSCEKNGDIYDAVLDKTAFFPEEGGQYSDKGRLGGARVTDVKELDGIIHHYIDAPVAVGSEVLGSIDFDERYEKMQCHSGEHILSGIIQSLFSLDNVGFHLGADDVTMDISAPLTREELDIVEKMANEVIYKNVEITSEFPDPSELRNMRYRSKLDLTDNVRIVRIGEYDACACCAPHVKRTGEIGLIKILDFAKLRGGIRIHIAAGRRAMKIFRDYYENAQSVSSMLSVPKSDISCAVRKLLDDFAEERSFNSQYRISVMEREAESLGEVKGNCVLRFDRATVDELIAFANIGTSKVEGILVLLSGCDGSYKYVISSKGIDLKSRVQDINKSLLGRGGGRSNMIQGSFASDFEAINRYFSL